VRRAFHLFGFALVAIHLAPLDAAGAGSGNPCARCHAKEVAGYEKNAMAHSLSQNFSGQPSGTFVHAPSQTKFRIDSDAKMTQSFTRGDVSGTYPVQYVIGSGSHAYGYLVVFGDYLFQSPLSYYTRRRAWDVAPGYETRPDPGFDRPVTAECVTCHSGHAQPVKGTLNRYASPPFTAEAISCDRCHGDGSAHIERPSRHNIINPQTLPARARDSVCEQCHLSGEVRILNPSMQFSDFKPGHELEEFFSVYVRDPSARSPSQNSIKVVSHSEQLALSVCARNSNGKLWCGTCHDPHQKPENTAEYYRARCLSCHGSESLKSHAAPVEDCIGCHMPKRQARDGAHTAFTDHRITRSPEPGSYDATEDAAALVAWHEPPARFSVRNMGLANIAVGERNQSSAQLDQGAQQLIEAMKVVADDPVILTKLGVVLLRKGMTEEAIETDELAARLDPTVAGYHANLGIAYRHAGQTEKSIAELEQAIRLDPGLAISYQTLAAIYDDLGKKTEARQTLQRLGKVLPNVAPAIEANR
jgi:tetratricopeptide (TPR) repeat protein